MNLNFNVKQFILLTVEYNTIQHNTLRYYKTALVRVHGVVANFNGKPVFYIYRHVRNGVSILNAKYNNNNN